MALYPSSGQAGVAKFLGQLNFTPGADLRVDASLWPDNGLRRDVSLCPDECLRRGCEPPPVDETIFCLKSTVTTWFGLQSNKSLEEGNDRAEIL